MLNGLLRKSARDIALLARELSVNQKTMYDYMREADNSEEDGFFPEDWMEDRRKSQKEEYFGKVEKLSELIEDHISSLVKRIEKLEVEDLDINIDVLLSELERKVEDENV